MLVDSALAARLGPASSTPSSRATRRRPRRPPALPRSTPRSTPCSRRSCAPEPFTFTFTGTSNTLRLPIRNTGAEPLLVDVRVRSPKLATDEPTQQVELPALELGGGRRSGRGALAGNVHDRGGCPRSGRLPPRPARRAQGTGQPRQRTGSGGHRRRRPRAGVVVVHPLAPPPRRSAEPQRAMIQPMSREDWSRHRQRLRPARRRRAAVSGSRSCRCRSASATRSSSTARS